MANSSINKICQIVHLKQVVRRWRHSTNSRHVSTGQVPMDVGPDRRRFAVPTRFINLPIFISLLNQASDELGHHPDGVLTLPTCDVDLFQLILQLLERDKETYGRLGIDDFVNIDLEWSATCEDSARVGCIEEGRKPLLHKART